MTLIQQFGFVTPIDCKERNVKPSHRCPFSDKLSLFRATITRTTLFCFATDVPLSFLKASEVRWNLTRGIWAFVFAFNCCPRGGSLCCRCCSRGRRSRGRRTLAACHSLQDWGSTEPAGVCTLTAKILFQKCLSNSYAWQLKELPPFYTVNRCLYF